MDTLEHYGEVDGVLSRAFGKRMIGQLVKCIWLEESVCIILAEQKRTTSRYEYYHIYEVYDFITGEKFWVDEEDLEKL